MNRSPVSWQAPENEYAATEKVTLRRLFSHSAGLKDGLGCFARLAPKGSAPG